MLTLLVREEAGLTMAGAMFINMELQKTFPDYTVETIKGVRNKKDRNSELLAQEMEKLQHSGAQLLVAETSDMAANDEIENIKRSINLSHILGREPEQRKHQNRPGIP